MFYLTVVLDTGVFVFLHFTCLMQGLSNLLVEEDKVEEEITDVESELEVLTMQVRGRHSWCVILVRVCAAV